MRIRIEFGPSKSSAYPWAIRLCKVIPSYKESVECGMTVHSVEISSRDRTTWAEIMGVIGNWKNVTCYLDGQIIPAIEIWNMPYAYVNGRRKYQTKAGDDIYDAEVIGPPALSFIPKLEHKR